MIKKDKLFLGPIMAIGIIFTVLFTFASCHSEGNIYGAPIDSNKGKTIELQQIFKTQAMYEGKNVILQGKTGQICLTSGCWVMLTDGTNQLFVQFYSFTVRPPKGSTIRVQGVLKSQNKVPYLAGEGLEIIR